MNSTEAVDAPCEEGCGSMVAGGAAEEELARSAALGDKQARNELYLLLQKRIKAVIYPSRLFLARMAQSKDGTVGPLAAEDLDQQAFILYCELLEGWRSERGPFVPYLLKMLPWRIYRYIRTSLHYRSKRLRQVRLRDGEDDDFDEIEEKPAGHIERGGGAQSDPQNLQSWQALTGQLRDDWRRFVELRFFEGLPAEEIARLSGKSTRSVNRLLRSALDCLRNELEEQREAE